MNADLKGPETLPVARVESELPVLVSDIKKGSVVLGKGRKAAAHLGESVNYAGKMLAQKCNRAETRYTTHNTLSHTQTHT